LALDTYRCADFEIDPTNRRFTRRGIEVSLEPKVLSVILQLLARPGALITRNELLDSVWGHRYVTRSTLNRVITLARRAFEDDTDEPGHIATVHGAGYRYIGPLECAASEESVNPVRFAPPPTARLPARVEDLIGREPELSQISALLHAQRAVTVLGPGGIGKTQFALETARRSLADFPDGIWFFDLAPMQHSSEWLLALASALGIPTANNSDPLPRIIALLQGRHALVLVDNCDRIAAGIGALLIEILRGTGDIKILATSQASLNFAGEQLMRLAPLALPPTEPPAADGWTYIAEAPAVAMLLTRVRSVQPGFRLDAGNAEAVAGICRRLDGMPLALELAAARFSLLSAEQVLRRLDDRFRFLKSATSGRDGRHQNLQLLLEWSFALLSRDEQQLLMWFSVFVQGWSVESAIELASALGHDPETAIELLTGLVNKSLVSVIASLSPPRYRLLETVREFASERLRAAGDQTRAREAHLALVVSMTEAAHADIVSGRMRERVPHLMHEHGNISRALEFASVHAPGRASALRIVGALMLYLNARGAYIQAVQWSRRALADSDGIDTPERGRAFLALGVAGVYAGAGAAVSSETALLDAARIAHLNGDWWTEAYANGYFAMFLANGGRSREADDALARIEMIGGQLDDPLLRGLAGLARGWLLLTNNELEPALEVFRAARYPGSDLHQTHFIDTYMGLALFGLGQRAEAARQWFGAMGGAVEVANIRGVAGSIEGCGYIAVALGEYADAARLLAAARKIRERTEVPLFRFWTPYHDNAHAELRTRLGASSYQYWSSKGQGMREEDVVNETRIMLQRFGGDEGLTNKPSGS
jgi:non-specific serine/threonine protein kinase